MKLMLTSFGIEDTQAVTSRHDSLFHRMPPVSFRLMNEEFMPDYELLVLCDQIVMDGASFERLVESPARAYSGVADTFRVMQKEGRVELVDFPSILKGQSTLLEKMLEHDMAVLDQWVVPLRDSLTTWRHFADMSMRFWRDEYEEMHRPDSHLSDRLLHAHHPVHNRRAMIMHEIGNMMHGAASEAHYLSAMVDDALSSSEKRKRKDYRDALREVLRAYLGYVNANLVLANELQVPFHDWLDFTPFYSTKFLSVGKPEDATQEERKQVEKLFTLAFPELAIRDTRSLLKVLNDSRIEDLRRLIARAVAGEVHFDDQFARMVLSEVLKSERKVTRFRNVLGYLTLPIGFIPLIGTPAQKAVEESVGIPVARKMKEKHRWFYMLSEVAASQKREDDKGE